MSKMLSLKDLREIGATTFADHRRDEQLIAERNAALQRIVNEDRLCRWLARNNESEVANA